LWGIINGDLALASVFDGRFILCASVRDSDDMGVEEQEGLTMVDKSNRYIYPKQQYNFAKELIDDLYAEIDSSENEWDRGFNAGIRFVINKLKRYTSKVERDLGIKAEG
jgi:hypothetical protein